MLEKLSVVAVFAARFWLEVAFRLACSVAPLVEEFASVNEAFRVPLADNAPWEAVALLFALPEVDEVLPPPDALLLFVELPTEPAVPSVPAAARLPVALKLPVALVVVAELLALAARALVVELDRFELEAADTDSVADADL